MKITILIGSKTGWFYPYALKLVQLLNKQHSVLLVTNEKKVKKGDLLFILSYPRILSNNILKLNAHNLVVHASKLPKGRGWSPLSWQILEGKDKIPVSLFEAQQAVDSGQIYLQSYISLKGHELIDEIRNKLAVKINKLIVKFVKKCPKIKGKPQIGEPSYYKRRTSFHSQLDINKSLKEQFNLFRIIDNKEYPAFFIYKDKKYILKITKIDNNK